MSADRPINADVPAPDGPEPKPEARPKTVPPKREARPKPARRPRQPKPLTPKLLAALVLIAVAFIVAAVLGSNGGPKDEAPGPAPAPGANGGATESAASQTSEELGYPSFATNNTTRIGGSEPAFNAAAVALAVFPSASSAPRPEAVALVAEDDWAGAVAAAVLMAEPVRAPVLISGSDLPDVSSEAFEALQPSGVKASGVQAFPIGDVAAPGGASSEAVGGGPAAVEAAAIAKLRDRVFGSAPAHILVAPSTSPEIAVPAAAWAARSGDPVLFAAADELPAATAGALRRHNALPVYVLGPSSAISSEVVREIGKIDHHVKRVSGDDAVANAIAFARYGDGDFGWNVNDPGHGFVLARTGATIDAAVAAPLSGSGTWGPLLLTDSAARLPAELRDYFLDVKPGYTTNPTRAFYNHVWVIGDQEAIDVNQQAEVNGLAELAKIGGGEK